MKLFAALALGAAVTINACGAALADPGSVRATVLKQLDAFRAGDVESAYALAAPSIKRMFPTPERFGVMVRRGYAPVYYNQDPVFLRSRAMGKGTFAQEVGLTGRDGRSWTALYTLARQDDGTWAITGCYLRPATGQNI